MQKNILPIVSSSVRTPRRCHGSALLCALVLCTLALCLASSAWAEKPVPATPAQSAMPMLPHLEWLLDSGGTLTVDDMGQSAQQTAFRPLSLRDLPRDTGTVWMRFTLAGRPSEVRPATLLLDMGEGVPDTPTLFVPKHNILTGATEWQSFTPNQRSVFLMPEARNEPLTAYLRMEGLPGIWFSPMLRTPHNAATALERLARPAVIVALAVVMLLCLLRGLTERGEWRVWASLYTAAALIHAVWGIPSTAKGHVDMFSMAAVLAPGIGLMLLPHVGRHLMRTRQTSRPIDIQLFLLSLPGAALTLLPLMPGYSWTTRLLDLWPAGTLIFVPTTLGAWLCGLPGARRFLLGCLLPPLGVAAGLLGMGSTLPAPVLATAPLWGLALGALIIAGTAAPQEYRTADATAPPSTTSMQALVDEDPNLRIITPDELNTKKADGKAAQTKAFTTPTDADKLALEEHLRDPIDTLLRDGVALTQCSLPPAARQLADSMLGAVHQMASTLACPPQDLSPPEAPRKNIIFDLQALLQQAHGKVSAAADSKNIALSWFMPPHLPQHYRGDASQLRDVLQMLLESSVRATTRGAVQLAVRRLPESVDPGHLMFTVIDSGTGMPPRDRSSLALARAWELAGAHRGFLGMECSPQGATVTMTLRFAPAGAEAAEGADALLNTLASQGIIVTEDNPGERQLLVFFLEGLPFTVREARSVEEAVELYARAQARLLIFDGDLPEAELRTAVASIRREERAQGFPPAMIMGLSSDDAQWEMLREAGFTHALPKPVTRSGLRDTVCQLLPDAQTNVQPSAQDEDMREVPLTLPTSAIVEPPQYAEDADEDVIDTGLPMPVLDFPEPAAKAAGMPLPALHFLEEDAPARMPVHDLPQEDLPLPTLQETEPLLPVQEPQRTVPAPGLPPLFTDSILPAQNASPAMRETAAPMDRESLPDEEAISLPLPSPVPPLPAETAERDVFSMDMVMEDLLAPLDATPVSMTTQAPVTPVIEHAPELSTVEEEMLAPIMGNMPSMPVAEKVQTISAASEVVTEPCIEPMPELLDTPEASPAGADTLSVQQTPPAAVVSPSRFAGNESHEDYLTSLLGGGEDLSRQKTQPEITPVEIAPVPPVQAPEPLPQHVATAPLAEPASPAKATQNQGEIKATRTIVPSITFSGKLEFKAEPQPHVTVPPLSQPAEGVAMPIAAPQACALDDNAEWVGEPQPITTASTLKQEAHSAVLPASLDEKSEVHVTETHQQPPGDTLETVHHSAPADSLEWVGEPRPIVRQPVLAPTPVIAPVAKVTPTPEPSLVAKVTPVFALVPESEIVTAPMTEYPAEVQEEAFVPLSFDPPAAPPLPPSPVAPLNTVVPATTMPLTATEPLRVAAPPVAAPPPPKPAPSAQQPAPVAQPSVKSTAPSPASPLPSGISPSERTAAVQPTYGSVSDPTPVSKPSRPAGTKELSLAQLLDYFDQSVVHARKSFENKNTEGVREGASFIAEQADRVGLRTLARMARCVTDAAKAADMDAIRDLLPELEANVERNRIALKG